MAIPFQRPCTVSVRETGIFAKYPSVADLKSRQARHAANLCTLTTSPFERNIAGTLWGSLFLAVLSFLGSGSRSRIGVLQAQVQQEVRHGAHVSATNVVASHCPRGSTV